MSTGSSELVRNDVRPTPEGLAIAELPPLTPAEQRVLEAITLPEEHQGRLHQRFQQAIDHEVETCIDPSDSDLIQAVASVIEWEWFADRGEQLPEGVALMAPQGNSPILRSKYGAANFNRVRTYLEKDALHGVLNTRNDLMIAYKKDDEIIEAFAAIARESDTYKLLRAIATDAPEPEDVPLSLAKRMIRETQIEDDVRKRHGLAQHDIVRMHPNAHQELQRGLYRLDDETEKQTVKQPPSARGRLLAFLVDEFNSLEYDDYETGQKVQTIQSFFLQGGDLYGRGIDGQEIFIGGDRLCDFSTVVSEGICPRKGLEYFADSDFIIYYLLQKILDPDQASKSALQLLDESCYGSAVDDVFTRGEINHEVLTYIRGVQSDIVRVSSYSDDMRPSWTKTSPEPAVEVHDLEGLKREQNTIIGIARGRTHLAVNHVVMSGNPQRSEYPKTPDQYDVRVELNEGVGGLFYTYGVEVDRMRGVPFVPGFELVGIDKSEKIKRFFFKRSEVDPYNGSAEVILDESQVQTMIERCQEIGFTALSEKLKAADTVSLADLAAMTSSASDYTFSQKYHLFPGKAGFRTDSFRQLIDEGGRLQVQCTGAATFLEYLINTSLPGSRTTAIAGYVIEPDGFISAAQHAQIMVVHEGNQYVLDATPGLGPEYGLSTTRGGESGSIYKSQAAAEREQPKKVAQEHALELIPQEVDEEDQLIVAGNSVEQRLAETAKRLEGVTERTKRLLKAHFNLPTDSVDDRMYEKVVKLKKDADPLRRVLELVLRSDSGQNVVDELDQQSAYIENVIGADNTTLRRVGIPRYDTSLLTALQAIIQDLRLQSTQLASKH